MTDYYDLPALTNRKFDRVLFVTVVFTDFEAAGTLASYQGKVRDSAALSEDTLKWLDSYNQMDVNQQLTLSFAPPEFSEDRSDVTIRDASSEMESEENSSGS